MLPEQKTYSKNISADKKIFLSLIFIFLNCYSSFAEIDFSSKDRILILSPHPDDESLTSAGIIQHALTKNAQIKIVYLTSGDYNEFSQFFYKKSPIFFRGGFVRIGKTRQAEAHAAMQYLGLKTDDLVFLGYPDRFTEAILTGFWDKKNPTSSLLTHISSVPYKDAFSFGAPYVGQSILSDLEQILKTFKPTKVFVSSPQDTNPDHRSFYVYLKVALLDLQKYINPTVYTYLVHKAGWPPRGMYLSHKELEAPTGFPKEIICEKFFLKDNEIKNKYKAISLYKSQLVFSKRYLFSFVRKNELFCIYPEIDLEKGQTLRSSIAGSKLVSRITYRRDKNFVYINITFNKKIAEGIKADIYLLGYKKSLDFSLMPKIFFKVKGKYKIAYNKRKRIPVNGIEVSVNSANMFIKFPLAAVNYPDYIFSRIILKGKVFALHVAPWVTLKM